MWRPIVLLLFSLTFSTSASDKVETWLEVNSQHFTVVTNANEKTGRRIANEFESMRSVFQASFPHLSLDNGSQIVALAIKGEKDFRALEPQAYLAKGQVGLDGLFLRAPHKNYILLRVDAEGEHPYANLYHEYTHFLLSDASGWLPLWLNEGLAEFYENADIHEKVVLLGLPSNRKWLLLWQNGLLPLPVLFNIDSNSSYYHEENRAYIFYAESWALTHYLRIKDYRENTHHMADYEELLMKKTDPVTAAARAFGDLNQLQSNLLAYIRQGSFHYLKVAASSSVDQTAFKARVLTPAGVGAIREDFLSRERRVENTQPEDVASYCAKHPTGFYGAPGTASGVSCPDWTRKNQSKH